MLTPSQSAPESRTSECERKIFRLQDVESKAAEPQPIPKGLRPPAQTSEVLSQVFFSGFLASGPADSDFFPEFFCFLQEGQQRSVVGFQRGHVNGLVIGDPVLPATVDYAQPLEGQRADRYVMIFPLADLHLVERLRPGAPVPGLSGEFVNALADELGTGPTVTYDAGLATAS